MTWNNRWKLNQKSEAINSCHEYPRSELWKLVIVLHDESFLNKFGKSSFAKCESKYERTIPHIAEEALDQSG
jgi:hypothetical protein